MERRLGNSHSGITSGGSTPDAGRDGCSDSMLEHVMGSQVHQAEHVQREVMDLQRNMPFSMKLAILAGRVMKKIVSMSGPTGS